MMDEESHRGSEEDTRDEDEKTDDSSALEMSVPPPKKTQKAKREKSAKAVEDGEQQEAVPPGPENLESYPEEETATPHEKKVPSKWYKDGNVYRLLIMLFFTLVLFAAELAVGLVTNSLALVSDAFHMASDCLSLGIGLAALQMAKRNAQPGSRYSYGLARAEVIGGLVNGVFLFSISLFIVYEALSRFIDIPMIANPLLIVYVASAALLMNIFGLFLFMGNSGVGHGHSHGGHSHSHGSKKKKKSKKNTKKKKKHEHGHEKKKKRMNLNLHAVFLHILGDALASLGAITSGLLIEFVPWSGRFYIDPILSVLISLLIMKSALPLVWSSIQILMQSGPKGLDLSELTAAIENIPSVLRVHDLHVWQLLGDKPIASIHVLCKKASKFMKTARQIKAIFHECDIHTVTIQPEFTEGKAANEDGVSAIRTWSTMLIPFLTG